MTVINSDGRTKRLVKEEAIIQNWDVHQRKGYISRRLFPVKKVGAPSGTLDMLPSGNFFRLAAGERAQDGSFPVVHHEMSDKSFNTTDYGLAKRIEKKDEAVLGSKFRRSLSNSKYLAGQNALLDEVLAANSLFNTEIFEGEKYTDTNATGGYWNLADSKPIDDINLGREAIGDRTGIEPDTLVISRKTYRLLSNNIQVMSHFSDAKDKFWGRIPLDKLADIFEVERVEIGRGIVDVGNDIDKLNTKDIWDEHYACLMKKMTEDPDDLDSPGLAAKLVYEEVPGREFIIEEYKHDHHRARYIRFVSFCDHCLFDSNFGHLFKVKAIT